MRSSTLILVFECFLFADWHQDSQNTKEVDINSYIPKFVLIPHHSQLLDPNATHTRTTSILFELGNLDHNAIQRFPHPGSAPMAQSIPSIHFRKSRSLRGIHTPCPRSSVATMVQAKSSTLCFAFRKLLMCSDLDYQQCKT